MRPSITEIAIIAFFIILLFGARKIPELMRGLGTGIKEFKEGLRDTEKPSKDGNGSETK